MNQPSRLIFATCLLLASAEARAQGELRTVKLDSKLLKTTETFKVWTPPGYDADADRRYPVIYCCQNTGMPTKQLAELFKAGHYPPFLLVNFEGLPWGGEHANAAVWSDMRQPSGSFFRTELIPWVDANYRTIAGNKGRVLIGCSKAGGGVTHLGLKYPGLFGAFVSLDGALRLYDNSAKDLDYTQKGDGYYQLIEKHGEAVKDLPILLIEGGWFWKQGRDYLGGFRKLGMKDIEVLDDRDLDHAVNQMFVRHLPEILTVFSNGTSSTPAIKPRIEPAGGVFAGPVKVTLTAPAVGIRLRYTTDGSDPSRSEQEVSGPLTLERSCYLRVVGKSPDGKLATRQHIARFELRPPLPAGKSASARPGLRLLLVKGSIGKDGEKLLEQVHAGQAEVLHRTTTAAFVVPEEAARAAGEKQRELVAVFQGELKVPEAGVYHLQVSGSSTGLYLVDAQGKASKVLQTRGAGKTAEAALVLERGAHALIVVTAWPSGIEPFAILRKRPDGKLEPLPADWLSH